jgi:GrpB-like predicted nucleotidyltransferase (UPF0157 family)
VSRHIRIVDPRPSWPHEFLSIAGSLRTLLGDRARRIDHVGSTAVPGLAAKDVIDVQVTVASLDDDLEDLFTGAGYGWHAYLADLPPASMNLEPRDLEKRVASERDGDRAANIHLRVDGRFNQRYALLFRDFLREHDYAARGYGDAKRALADIVDHDTDAYYSVKQPVFDILIGTAFAWADRSGWEPGPPDA